MTHSAYTRETFAAFRDPTGRTGGKPIARTAVDTEPVFKRLRRRIVWRGSPRLILTGPNEETWDIRFITEYPCRDPRRSTLRIRLAVLAALAAYALAVVLLVSP